MAKDPAFLFYPNDWLGGTMGMTFEEKGAYMELLMMQFNRGHMTKDMIGQTVGQLWDNIKDKFTEDSKGLFYNKRLEEEQLKRKKFTESRRNNKSGKNQHSKSSKKEGHTTSRMENENVIENISKKELEREMLVNLELLQDVSDHFGISDAKVKDYLKEFCFIQGDQKVLDRATYLEDKRKHFIRWVDIELDKEIKGAPKEESPNDKIQKLIDKKNEKQ